MAGQASREGPPGSAPWRVNEESRRRQGSQNFVRNLSYYRFTDSIDEIPSFQSAVYNMVLIN